MEQPRNWAMAAARSAREAGRKAHPQLLLFDEVRMLLAATGLAPTPDVYGLFWRYVCDDCHPLSLAIDIAMAEGRLDTAAVERLRAAYL